MNQVRTFTFAIVTGVLAFSMAFVRSAEAPPTPSETTGPISAKTPPCKWGTAVKDETDGSWVWFGGTGGSSASGALLTWVFKDGAWKRAEFKEPPAHAEAQAIALEARKLYAAVANRYYLSENAKAQSARLDEAYKALADRLRKAGIAEEPGKQLAETACGLLNELAGKLASAPSAAEVAAAREAWTAVVKLEFVLAPEPAPRGYPGMAYDAESRKIVLFGGEGVFGAYNDTWIYDCKSIAWSLVRPPVAPSPRCGHGIVASKGKVYVAGGFEPLGSMSYCAGLWTRLPMDVWAFDLKSNTWTLLKAGEGKPEGTVMQPAVELSLATDGKTLSWKADRISYGKKVGEVTGTFELPGSDAGTEKAGVPSGSIKVRGLGFDPAWYEKVPPADAAVFQATLKAMPPNKWINVKPPVQHVNRDWGTTVLDLEHDQLLHWAGGHSSHCGTDVAHYSLATNRWHILYTPELPFEYAYSNDGAPIPTLSNSPWGPHSYLSYAWDQVSGKMYWAGNHGAYRVSNPCGLWTYDPETYAWSCPQWKIEGGWFDIERHKTCMVGTPQGIVVWGDKRGGSGGESGIWLAKAAEQTFAPIAATDKKDGTTLPFSVFGDRHGITYDAKRDRTLIFHFGIKEKNKVWACDLKTKAVTVLEPKGSASFPADASIGREATYLPDDDVVLICTPVGKASVTLIYDCAANQWLEMPAPFVSTEKPEPLYGVSTGVEWDPKRKMLWLVQTDGAVYTMRFERASAALKALE